MNPTLAARLPNFFLLGVMKSGTTSLAAYLAQHPQIYISKPKEPHFFSSDYYSIGIEAYARRHFAGAERYPARGDATATTFHQHRKVIPRLREHYGNSPLKFIILFREPAARDWSHWLHFHSANAFRHSFEDHVAQTTSMRGLDESDRSPISNYASHVRAWLAEYPRQQFYFLLTEDLRDPTGKFLRPIFEFLGVNPEVTVDTSVRHNPAARPRSIALANFIQQPPSFISWFARRLIPSRVQRNKIRRFLRAKLRTPYTTPPPIPPQMAAVLRSYYRDEIIALSQIIERDLSHWLAPPDATGPKQNP